MKRFQIFGSESSVDTDVMFFVDEIPSTSEAHELIKELNEPFTTTFGGKVCNGNLVIVRDGMVQKVFKGTEDEVNNSMYWTYGFHNQTFPQAITQLYKRDEWLKSLRVARFLLSFYSRTDLRDRIKPALRGDITMKLNVLEDISFETMPIVGKKESEADIYKVIAFQFAQFFGLSMGIEIYTKEHAIEMFPRLRSTLMRETPDLAWLDKLRFDYIDMMYRGILNHDDLVEYDFRINEGVRL